MIKKREYDEHAEHGQIVLKGHTDPP